MRLLGGQQNGQLTPNIFSEKEKGTFLRNGIHALASPRPIQKVSAAAFHKKKQTRVKKIICHLNYVKYILWFLKIY